MAETAETPTLDVAIVGAGFGGMYMLYKLRDLGFKTRVYEAGTMSAARGTGTGIRARDATSKAWNIPMRSLTSCSRSGNGRSVMRGRNPFWNTPSTSRTGLTFAATSSSKPASPPPASMKRPTSGR